MNEVQDNLSQISKYYQSFSGTDTLAFILMPGSKPVVIGSLTTISYSMFRNKKPVINIGRTNINGVTRGSRIFAGTMVFTLINQHWLRELQDQLDWLKGFDELKVDELPLFDIMIVSANEYGNYVTMYIYGIDFTDEAQVISVEDLFTENTFSFIARDISTFKQGNQKKTKGNKPQHKEKYEGFSQKFYVLDSSSIGLDDLAKLEKEFTISKIEQDKMQSKNYILSRELYYSSSKIMMGNDVAEIQELLNIVKNYQLPINGIFDKDMDNAVKNYQSDIGHDINGVVDDKLYNALKNNVKEDGIKLGVVVNKYGAYVYRHMSLQSDIVDTRSYKEQIKIYTVEGETENGIFRKWYKTDTGYIIEEDVYSSYYTGNIIEFPTVKYDDNNAYVTLIQSSLSLIYPEFTNISGLYDYDTQEYIKKLQKEHGLYPSGIVDYDTWLLLESLSGNVSNKVSEDNFKIELNTLPGIYNIASADINNLDSFDVTVSCDNYINIKVSTICIYDDKNTETKSKMITVKEQQVIHLEDMRNAFVYNPKFGKVPKQIDYIIYPYNKKPYKWTIMYS